MFRAIFFLLAALGGIGLPANASSSNPHATVVFMTDFGLKDPAVAVCKGVMWSINPELRIVDLTHDVPPYDIGIAGEFLARTLPFYPAGTVFVAVIDPGVGSARKAVAVRTKAGHFLVGPDNGLFANAIAQEGFAKAVELRNDRFFRHAEGPNAKTSFTFHGRDIFSPVGAHLASGTAMDDLGPAVKDLTPLSKDEAKRENEEILGKVVNIEEPYGNVVTNVPKSMVEEAGIRIGDELEIQLQGHRLRLPYKNTFSDVPRGRPVALIHSTGVFSLSINLGDFAKMYDVKSHSQIIVRRAK